MELNYLKNVVTLELLPDKCTGCERCVQVCPHDVLEIYNGTASIINRDACMECGACAKNCLSSAIRVKAGVG